MAPRPKTIPDAQIDALIQDTKKRYGKALATLAKDDGDMTPKRTPPPKKNPKRKPKPRKVLVRWVNIYGDRVKESLFVSCSATRGWARHWACVRQGQFIKTVRIEIPVEGV